MRTFTLALLVFVLVSSVAAWTPVSAAASAPAPPEEVSLSASPTRRSSTDVWWLRAGVASLAIVGGYLAWVGIKRARQRRRALEAGWSSTLYDGAPAVFDAAKVDFIREPSSDDRKRGSDGA